jgi:hypothetical protein
MAHSPVKFRRTGRQYNVECASCSACHDRNLPRHRSRKRQRWLVECVNLRIQKRDHGRCRRGWRRLIRTPRSTAKYIAHDLRELPYTAQTKTCSRMTGRFGRSFDLCLVRRVCNPKVRVGSARRVSRDSNPEAAGLSSAAPGRLHSAGPVTSTFTLAEDRAVRSPTVPPLSPQSLNLRARSYERNDSAARRGALLCSSRIRAATRACSGCLCFCSGVEQRFLTVENGRSSSVIRQSDVIL